MGNLGLYQVMTTWAKKVGGPIQLASLTALTGYGILRCVEAGIRKIYNCKKKDKTELLEIYTIRTQGKSNEGIVFEEGARFRVLEVDEEAVLIELIGDANNPYFASGEFLRSISDYK